MRTRQRIRKVRKDKTVRAFGKLLHFNIKPGTMLKVFRNEDDVEGEMITYMKWVPGWRNQKG